LFGTHAVVVSFAVTVATQVVLASRVHYIRAAVGVRRLDVQDVEPFESAFFVALVVGVSLLIKHVDYTVFKVAQALAFGRIVFKVSRLLAFGRFAEHGVYTNVLVGFVPWLFQRVPVKHKAFVQVFGRIIKHTRPSLFTFEKAM
jgi:hypothetical protein